MLYFQILSSLFIVFALWRIIKRYREERVPKSEIIVWLVLWVVVTTAIWWPRGTDILAQKLGVTRGVDLLVTASLGVIFYLLFRLFSHINNLQKQMTELVRRLAIIHHENEKKRYDAKEN